MARSLKVLVVDSEPSVSAGGALFRGFRLLGHEAHFFDQTPWVGGYVKPLPGERYLRAATRPLAVPALNLALLARAFALRPDLVLVLKGAHVLPETLASLRRATHALAMYATDDFENPLNTNERMRRSLPEWDVVFTPRSFAIPELRAGGARRVELLPFGYDETVHRPSARLGALATDVAEAVTFVGTWAPERATWLEPLAGRLPMRIYGEGWQRVADGSPLREAIRLRPVYGEDFREIVTHAAIDVSLLRKGNRDRHNMRTFEVPACRGFMLAERTEEHQALFEEDVEAVYFGSGAELEEKAARYLRDAEARRRIAEAGHRRVVSGKHRYRDRAARIVEVVDEVLR